MFNSSIKVIKKRQKKVTGKWSLFVLKIL